MDSLPMYVVCPSTSTYVRTSIQKVLDNIKDF